MVTYKEAGVDVEAADSVVEKLRRVCPDIGGFGGLYPLGDQYLVAGTDGVGTKLKVAEALGRHETIGIDLVAMCVNDILTSGAKPLFFLDYFATGKLDTDQLEQVLQGILAGCREAGCVLLGGETAEMPGFYPKGQYDLAGFAVGVVDKERLIDGSTICEGDVVLGIPSSGFHSNGYSLIRKVTDRFTDELLTPTRIYVKEVLAILERAEVKGMAHITGGGVVENLPRVLPAGLGARLNKWPVPKMFSDLQKRGNIPEAEMYRTFNMGMGYLLVLAPSEAKKLTGLTHLGTIVPGEGVLII